MKETTQILREKGLKVTPQRIAVYNMLRSTTQHPNAETIYERIISLPLYPGLSKEQQEYVIECVKKAVG